jgi:mono/diheme cytochrome c family protein
MLVAPYPQRSARRPVSARVGHALTAALSVVLLASVAGAATPRAPDGRRIYQKQCASCHGAKGEGVKDKYADALTGDWSVSKLTRYVQANMPEDKPETLSLAEAEAASRYLHDSFYSRAAQARINPARVELAYLTTQQYAITVADLLRGFGEPDGAVPAERGLNATYYSVAQRGRFDAAKIVHRGVDRELDFTFAEGTPAREKIGGVTDFSMQWRGALVADETGDYEIVVRTPNSVRVWINSEPNPGEAIIDVNVSTPESPDHRATVRLLGGRVYPIAVDYWALPAKPGAPPPAFSLRWKPPHGSERPIPRRNLSPARVRPTFVTVTRFPADDSSVGYARSGAVSKAWDEATTSAAFEVSNYVVKHLDRLAGTKSDDPARLRGVEGLAEKFVTAAFRRPLSADEKRRYITERFKGAPDEETAIKRVVLLTLKSPQFLYVEIPAGSISAPRVASRLSFGLWDSLPDAELTRAAVEGRLRTRAEVSAQANRMIADVRARAKLREFFHHWLQMRYVEDVRKDPALYPDFTPEIIDDLRTSMNLFLDEVVWSERSDFRELLRADYVMMNQRLARFYGLPAPEGEEFARVSADPTERSGVLTHPYLLAAFSYKSTTSPIHRGVFLTRNIVGRALKSPPTAVAFNDAEFGPDLSMREKVATLTRSESCQGCHAVINPLGFSLEWYDAVGRFRREENGRAINALSDYITDDNQTVRLGGARDVAEFAIANERANDAFIEQLFHHVVKQPMNAYGPVTSEKLRQSFIASGYNLRQLLVEIATLAALRGLEPRVAVHP